MLLKNPDALKCWLIIILEPICDADSSALARYVLALLKKDKSEEELKNIMIEQLDVFLGEETNPFVDKLFDTIKTEEYLSTPITPVSSDLTRIDSPLTLTDDLNVIKTESDQEPNSIVAKLAETPTSSAYINDGVQTQSIEQTKTKDSQQISNSAEHIDGSENSADRPDISSATVNMLSSTTLHTVNNHIRSASPPAVRTNTADKENQPRESRRRRASLRSRSHSRSRSNDRLSRRSRSRDHRMSEREKNLRQFRNKSPVLNDTRYDRRHFVVGNDRRRMPGNIAGVGGANMNDIRRGRSRSRSTSADRNRSKSNLNTPERHQIERDAENRQRQRCREYDDKGYCARADVCPWDHSPLQTGHKVHINPMKSRSPSPTLERGKPKTLPMIIADRQLLHKLEKRQRCRDFDEKGYCVRGETCPWDHGINPVVFEGLNNPALISMSLREYNPDAPEIWARGSSPNNIASRNVSGAPSINPFTGVARPSTTIMNMSSNASGAGIFPSDKNRPADYTRAGINGPGFHASAPGIPFPFNPAAITTPLQRELIPIPVVDANTGDVGSIQQQSKRRFELEDSVAIAEGPAKRKVPLNSRLGPRVASMQNNCSLELRKVPRGLNTIAHLNNHFAKFGKIVNIQISYDGDPEAAIVTFSTHAEANVAYRSTEAVLNNRFIKVFWHTQDSNSSNNNAIETNANTNPNRKNSQYHLNNIPAVPTPAADSAKTTNTAAAAAAAVVSSQTPTTTTAAAGTTATPNGDTSGGGNNSNTGGIVTTPTTPLATTTHAGQQSLRLKNNVARQILPAATNAIIRKKQEEQAKAVVQLANGLRKRKQELLQSYLKQMKSAVELVERAEANDPQRNKTLETIKVLQETIDKLRKEIANEQEQVQAQINNQQPPPKKTKEQQKKELLDIELELFAQQQEGNDTSAIQKRLEDLQRSLGILPGSAAATGASSKPTHFTNARNNARGRASYPEGSTRVDRRPKTIIVTGFTKEEAEFVLGHFKHFGEITKHDVDKEIPQLILSYATRANAEQAVLRGKVFKDKRLQISWAPVITANAKTTDKIEQMDSSISDVENMLTSSLTPKLFDKPGKEVEPITPDILPELRLEDEEEEDESEDRTWRR